MKSHKITKPLTSQATTDLRLKDPKVLRTEIVLFCQKIAVRVAKEPQKSAVILSEWLDKPASAKSKKAA